MESVEVMVLEFAASLLPSKEAFAAPKSQASVILLTLAHKSIMTNELVQGKWLVGNWLRKLCKSGSAEQCTFDAHDYLTS